MSRTIYQIITKGTESWGSNFEMILAETEYSGVASGLLDYFEDTHHKVGELYINTYVRSENG